MSLALIAAIAKNNCIGKDGKLPWHLPEDLKHFKELTVGKPVLMGRKTWESLPENVRPLPERVNIVITRQQNYPVPEGVKLYDNVMDAVLENPDEDIMVIGGGEIFRETIGLADTLYITHVDQTVDGQAFFPTIDPALWKETARENHEGYAFVTYKKRETAKNEYVHHG